MTDTKHTKYNIGDIVMMKVGEVDIRNLGSYIQVNKNLPETTPKSYGHTYMPSIHKYAVMKNNHNILYIVYTPRIGVIKNTPETKKTPFIKHAKTMNYKVYEVIWENREKDISIPQLGKPGEIEHYFDENLVKLTEIERFITQDELVDYYGSIYDQQ